MKNSQTKICVPVCVSRANGLADAIRRASEVADSIELRLDYLDNSALILIKQNVSTYLNESTLPQILTLRSVDQGGSANLNVDERYNFWSSLTKLPDDCLIDLEHDLAIKFANEESGRDLPTNWDHVICSYHDFVGVPSDLEQIYARMAATPARVLKVAVQADDAIDCIPAFRLLDRARSEGREMIAIAMGQAGIMTRILGPLRGSFLTYGALDDESATAPGQITARDLRNRYRIDHLDCETEITGLIGKPVSHSISPGIHNAAFEAAGVKAVFIPFEVRDLDAFIRRMVRATSREIDWNLRGLSVTAPHKTAVMKYLDWVDPNATNIGAVNTIVIEKGQLHGYNTDAAAFVRPLKDRLGSLHGQRCAVVGAGGAARAVVWALKRESALVTLFVRDLQKSQPIADELAIECRDLANANFEGFDVIVNATPLGTRGRGHEQTPAIAEQLRGVRLAYDLVYNPTETRFIREARAAGCETIGGLEMLIAQAVEQFKLWMGIEPDVESMRSAAESALLENV